MIVEGFRLVERDAVEPVDALRTPAARATVAVLRTRVVGSADQLLRVGDAGHLGRPRQALRRPATLLALSAEAPAAHSATLEHGARSLLARDEVDRDVAWDRQRRRRGGEGSARGLRRRLMRGFGGTTGRARGRWLVAHTRAVRTLTTSTHHDCEQHESEPRGHRRPPRWSDSRMHRGMVNLLGARSRTRLARDVGRAARLARRHTAGRSRQRDTERAAYP